jgi:6-pyruvoyltetrahydropterin/6-carboxytetrahydropterin synthase
MVVDFSAIKRVVGKWIDETLDHRLLLNQDDPIIPELLRQGEPFVTVNANPTAETIARLIFERVAAQGMPVTEVTLWESENSCATYRPTPGRPDEPLEMREVAGQ